MKPARLALGALAAALVAASTASAAEQKPQTLATIPHLVKRSEPARPAPKLLAHQHQKGPAPGETARKLILADAHFALTTAATVPTLITNDTNGWSQGARDQQHVYTMVSYQDNVNGADLSTELGSIDTGPNYWDYEFYNFSASKPTATFHQFVALVPGQQYVVEVALNDFYCPGPGGELDVLSKATGSQTIPVVDDKGFAHVMFFYTYQPELGQNNDDILYTLKPNQECGGLFVDSIAYVPFNPVN